MKQVGFKPGVKERGSYRLHSGEYAAETSRDSQVCVIL